LAAEAERIAQSEQQRHAEDHEADIGVDVEVDEQRRNEAGQDAAEESAEPDLASGEMLRLETPGILVCASGPKM
jgi:hypothetical protein